MNDQIEDFVAQKWTGNTYIKSCYLDNREVVKSKLKPNEGGIRNLVGAYPLIFAPIKFEGNETAVGVITKCDKEFKDIASARKFLSTIPDANEMMTDKAVELFLNTPARNVFKTVYCNRFYNGSNIVIIGDAAHPFPPVAQGINIAL